MRTDKHILSTNISFLFIYPSIIDCKQITSSPVSSNLYGTLHGRATDKYWGSVLILMGFYLIMNHDPSFLIGKNYSNQNIT